MSTDADQHRSADVTRLTHTSTANFNTTLCLKTQSLDYRREHLTCIVVAVPQLPAYRLAAKILFVEIVRKWRLRKPHDTIFGHLQLLSYFGWGPGISYIDHSLAATCG